MASTHTQFAHLQIPLEDVLKATNNFHQDNIISRGDFGRAYKGKLSHSGKMIKIIARRLDRKRWIGDVEFWTEVSALSNLKHTNIVSIIGFCDEKNEKVIITSYESKGSLSAYLNSPNLTWTQRLRISVGVARALSYLRHDKGRDYGFIHRNINSYTILLDDNWEAKLSCFEISIKQSVNRMDQFIFSEPVGTIGHVDPTIEMTGHVSHKSDIYSFGVVLFEILCGREAFIEKDANDFLAPLAKYHYENKTLEDIIHPNLWNQILSPESHMRYSKVAYSCLEEVPSHRPYMDNIVHELEKALELHLRHEDIGNNLRHLKIPLSDLKLATDNFSEAHRIRSTSYCNFYKAKLDYFDKENASSSTKPPKKQITGVIKRILCGSVFGNDTYREEYFFREIEVLTSVKHHGIVTLHGYCGEGSEMILVLDDFPNGYLSRCLTDINPKRILTWEQRLKICIDVAHALKYLHYEMEDHKVLINRDISSDEIGLTENFGAKIVHFGLSLFLPPNQYDEALYLKRFVGRPSFTDPVYQKIGKLKRESDVYSFGVILFEILSGKLVDDPIYLDNGGVTSVARRKFLTETIDEMIDPTLIKEENGENTNRGPNKDSLKTFIKIAFRCVAETQDQRPTMKSIIKELEKALLFQDNRVQHPDIEQVDNVPDQTSLKLQFTHGNNISEEQVQCLNTDQVVDTLENQALELHLMRQFSGNNMELLKIPLNDIKLATNNFSEELRIRGSPFYHFYKAVFEHFDEELTLSGNPPKRHIIRVVKRIVPGNHFYQEEYFIKEIDMLTRAKHRGIATLHGFCVEDSEMILVYDDFSNGFLGGYLDNLEFKRILTWEKRLKICIDVAHALNYLHYEIEDQKVIINCGIHTNNIVLDENLGAKIVDFEISQYLPTNQYDEALLTKCFGIRLYKDPEYEKNNELKRELDVYSFGVVLFEILCGRRARDQIYVEEELTSVVRRRYNTRTIEDIIDPIIKEETRENSFILNRGANKDSLHAFIEIAYHCVAETQDHRPTMKVVVKELENALSLQENSKNNPRIPLEYIIRATGNFHNKNYIGGGGFGRVFKGTIKDGDKFKTIVAKRLDKKSDQGEQQFLSELKILLEYKHENVIGLVGYCDEKDDKIIVYEYASHESLDRSLHDASNLTWMKRLNICIDVASALYFLHGGFGKQAKVIHRDIKTANILLNHDWKAKLADFGLSLVSPIIQGTDFVIDHICGTRGYLDPLYKKSRFLTIESDIYSFGVVLFEILCGRSTYAFKEHVGHFLQDFITNRFKEGRHDEVVFEKIKEQIVPKSLSTFQNIAYQCLHPEREKRPTTKQVLTQLKKALKFQDMASRMTKFSHLQIPLEGIVNATNNFHHDNFIRRDGLGTIYKGQLAQSGMKIAARRFNCKHGEGDLEFLAEISALSDLKHTNLVSIIGFCDEGDEKIIVTRNEATERLWSQLNNPNLTWGLRLRICVGVALALSYLHHDEGRDYAIIHCNINSDTILLDDNLEPKLSGFELSIKQFGYCEDQVCFCEHSGRTGRMDPAIEKTGGVTHKSDIYSFGVVLFEMLWGSKMSTDGGDEDRNLASLAMCHFENPETLQDIIDPDLWNQMSPSSLVKYSRLAYSCLNEERAQRPFMDDIISKLREAMSLQSMHEYIGQKWGHLKFRLSDIKLATNNFSDIYNIGARHDFATCFFYRAKLDHFDRKNPSSTKGDSTVVIKRFPYGDKVLRDQMFYTEIRIIMSVKHRNIVTLRGYCVEGSERILVTDNISNGYLVDYLIKPDMRCVLTWVKRLKICIDVAHALNYLHYEMEDQRVIINRNISSSNIGLDENFGAKIVDFCLSTYLHPFHEKRGLLTRLGLLYKADPEYAMTGRLKRESDVYSFGVVLFEILCGRLAEDPIYMKESHKGLAHFARQSFYTGTLEDMIDPIIMEEASENNLVLSRGPNKDSLHAFIEIAYQCVAVTQDQRPTMKVVVKELEKALYFQENNKDNPRIALEDIKLATQNFHDDNCIGGKGWKFYKGNLQDGDGVTTIVAKRLDTRSSQGEKQFLSELQILWEYKHENVISLVGYCNEQNEKIIVYEYASKGSLDMYLNNASLTWVKRLNICLDVASALDFIHGGVGKQAKVIHRDIKTANILLSADWKAKLAYFGHSLISPINPETDYVIDHACGTPGYLDPLYIKSGFLTTESDIYSFGVVLFEILCGRSTFAVHKHEGHYLPDFIKNIFEEGKQDEVVFDQIREQIVPESLTAFQEIAHQCLHHEREKRPTSEEVLMQLQMALAFQISKGE